MITLSENKIDIIYHLGDIHIRPLQRHDEYREVFDKLYKLITKGSLVVICGDIVHEKDKITPELIVLFREFLKNLSLITDVIVFSGNHDLIENNLTRTSILEALTQDINVHYLKYTDKYKYGDIVFHLKSLEDKKPFIKPTKKNINIALYHGCLREIGFNKDGYSVSDFKQYDLTLLGDIHQRQFLDKNVAYSGSLIQQNYGETIDKHGFIKWNIRDMTYEEIDIHNDYGYITLNIKDDVYELPELPKYSRIRYKYINSNIEEIKKIIATKTKVISDTDVELFEDTKDGYEEEFVSEIDDRDIFKSECKYELDNILKLDSELKKDINFNTDKTISYKWTIDTLEFKNIFIYGGNKLNKINFKDKNNVLGILGNNAIGKSSIINIILFALFDKISSDYSSADVLNKNSSKLYVKITFKIGEDTYIIEREGSVSNGKNFFKTNFMKVEDKSIKSLNGKDKIRTQQIINQIIGERDIFILCNVVSNSHNISLLGMTSNSILETFTKLLKLDKYEELNNNISKKIKKNNLELSNKKGNLEMIEDINEDELIKKRIFIEELQDNLLEFQNDIHDIKDITKEYEEQLDILRNEILEIRNNIEPELELENRKFKYKEERPFDYNEYCIKKNKLEELKDLEYKNVNIRNIYKNKTIEELEEIKKKYKINKINSKKNIKNINVDKIKTLEQEIINLENSISIDYLYQKAIQLKQDILEDNCNKNKLIEFLESIKCTKEIEKIKNNLKNKKASLIKLQKDLTINEENIKYNKLIDKQIRENNKNEKEIKRIENAIFKVKILLRKDLEKEVEILEYNRYIENVFIIENNKKYNELINKIETEYNKINKFYLENKNKENEFLISKEKIKNTLEYENKLLKDYCENYNRKKELSSIIKELDYQSKLFNEYKRLVDKKCIPKIILKQKITFIENDINKYLENMVNFKIKFKVDKKVEIDIKKNKRVLKPYMCSGYERFILNIIIKQTLNKYCFNNKSNIFFIDEGLDCIDDNNLNKFEDFIKVLNKNYNNIILISQIDRIKKFINNQIYINHNGSFSSLLDTP